MFVNVAGYVRSKPWACTPGYKRFKKKKKKKKHNADVNSQNNVGRTPLFESLFHTRFPPDGPEERHVDVVRRLLEHGANPNIRDHSHSTPLHRASSQGWHEVTRLLISHGANVDG
ncbi:ankyrin repeat-containing domain protein [Lactarius pseudohatsudake]|nr:ankyrin repeat-containing domain protein [Lactarius pseudohatsudake]